MPIPITALTGVAFRVIAPALVGYAAARIGPNISPRIKRNLHAPDLRIDTAHDAAPLGYDASITRGRISASAKWRRIFRLDDRSPNYMVEASFLARLRIRKA